MIKCKNCGAKINKHYEICPECGESVVKDKKMKKSTIIIVIAAVFVILMLFGIFGGLSAPVRGYYENDSKPYYYQDGVWYTYSEFGGWYAIVPGEELLDNYKEHYKGNTYDTSSSFTSFEDSEYYVSDGK